MKMKCLLACLVLCLVVGGTAYAQSDPFHGTWRMNPTKSTSPSGQPLPDVEVLVLEIAGHFGSPDHAETGTNDITAQRTTVQEAVHGDLQRRHVVPVEECRDGRGDR